MRRILGAVVVISATLLSAGCAASASVDLDAARAWAAEASAQSSDGPGLAGAAMLSATPDPPSDDGVRLDFSEPVNLTRAQASCFGGHKAEVIVTVTASAAGASTGYGLEIPCDEQPHDIPFGDDGVERADSAFLTARADPSTYAYVEVIQALTAER